jgi:glycosyltransferase involved in cell wall biosynthesis
VTRAVFAIPGDLATATGGYGYDRAVLARFAAAGIAARHLPLPGSFPFPDAADLAVTAAALRAIAPDEVILLDGLAGGALPADLLASLAAPVVALVHHPLARENGLAPATAASLHASEQAGLALARHVVVTSPVTAETLVADFAVPDARITVAEPGTARAPRAAGSGSTAPALLAVGTVSPRKGFDVLVRALAAVADLQWHLTIVGSLARDAAAAAALGAVMAETGLASRITLAGELDEGALAAAYHRADLFVIPSLYEGYGMAAGEAMVRGLPIVTTTGGALARTIPEGAALRVPPGNVPALAAALRRALAEPGLLPALAEASAAQGRSLPDWDDTTRRIAAVLHAVSRDLSVRRAAP